MSSQLGEAYVPIRATLDKLDGDLKQARSKIDGGLKQSGGAAGTFGSAISKIAATGALLAIGQQALQLGKASIETASDIEEAASKFSYVFGPAAQGVAGDLDVFAAAANRSQYELKAMAADVGALTENTLGSKEAAGEMAVGITKLAVDLASFNNVAEDDALLALKAGLIGEAEPMRRFGVLLSAAAVEARVMADNVGISKNEITDAMKIQARYNIIMEQTATAQGDAIRTSESYANVSRGAEAATQELYAAIGNLLLPAATEGKIIFAELTRQLTDYINVVATGGEQVAVAAETGREQAQTYEEVEARLGRVNEAYDLSRSALGRLTGTQDEAKAALEDSIMALVAGSDGYDEFAASAKEAGLTTSDVANIMNLFESDLHGNTEAWYEVATAQAAAVAMGEEYSSVDQNLTKYIVDTTAATDDLTESTTVISSVWSNQPSIMERLAGHYDTLSEKAEANAAANEKMVAAYQDILDGNTLLVNSYDELGTQFYTVGGRTAEQNESLSELRGEYEKTQDEIRSLTSGTAGLGLSTDELNAKLADQQEQAALLTSAMAPLEAVSGELASRDVEMAFNMDAVNQSMRDAAVEAGVSMESLVMMDIVRGNLTKTEAQAILMEVQVRAEAERLGKEYAAGRMSVQDMDAQMHEFITTLQSVPPSVATKATLDTDEAHANARSLLRKLSEIDGKVVRGKVIIETEGGVPQMPGSGGGKSGGDAPSDKGNSGSKNNYATGTDGWQIVPPGYPNDSYPIWLSSGEPFAVLPTGESYAAALPMKNGDIDGRGMAGGDLNVYVEVPANFNGDATLIRRMVDRGVDEALKRRGSDADYRRRS